MPQLRRPSEPGEAGAEVRTTGEVRAEAAVAVTAPGGGLVAGGGGTSEGRPCLRPCLCLMQFRIFFSIVPRAQKKEDQRAAGSPALSTQLALCLRLAIDLKGRKLATRRNPR